MVGIKKKPLDIAGAIEAWGGFARYFGTTEPLSHIAALLKGRSFSRALSCCGGGDAVLTFLGLGKKGGEVFAFDQNPAQLFVLACKARMFEDGRLASFDPSFDTISRMHLGRIRSLPRNIQKLQKLVALKTGKEMVPSLSFSEKFGIEIDSGLYPFDKKMVYWADDKRFISAIRKNLRNLRFINAEILFLSDWFPKEYLDVIYLSDIPLHNAIPYYLERLRVLLSRLKPGGLVIGNTKDLNELDRNPTTIEILSNYATLFGLRHYREKEGLLALEKVSAA